jgi:hypothetical protein
MSQDKSQDKSKLTRRTVVLTGAAMLGGGAPAVFAQATRAADTFERQEIIREASGFFGATSAALAELIERVFREQGQPNAYIAGREASGAIGIGLRYGDGDLVFKRAGRSKIFWSGPSIGFDFGGNASKVFTLAYNVRNRNAMYQRFPGVDGSVYVVAGFGMNYQRSGNITLAPIRTGVGLRAGVNVGYLHYNATGSWLPF